MFSRSVLSGSLWSHGLQHARFLCPSLSPRICSHLCPLSQWCYPAISSSVVPFSSCPQSFPVSGSFIVSQLFTSGCQSIEASALNYLHETIKGESAQQCLALSLPVISSQCLPGPRAPKISHEALRTVSQVKFPRSQPIWTGLVMWGERSDHSPVSWEALYFAIQGWDPLWKLFQP